MVAGKADAVEPEPDRHPGGDDRPWWRDANVLHLAGILLVAAGLRLWDIDRTSLWYDEVVSMRVARTDSVPELLKLLDQTDGTRAPLHSLVLQNWLRVFGPSAMAGRSASALFGILTVGVIYVLGRQAFDANTGRWAAWLGAVCPPLVYYSQEARMYAWLVFLTCLSWLVVLSFRKAASPAQCALYWLLLSALVYSHPLGLFMVTAHGVACLLVRRALKLKLLWWLAIQIAVILTVAPWLRRYLDHGTDYPVSRYPIRFLLAVPLEYVGGNGIALLVCLAIVASGLLVREDFARSLPENAILLTWTGTPPLLLYAYSYFFQPIFGPPRYHLFIAPAYLILLAHGLSKLPWIVRWPAAVGGLVLSLSLLSAGVYDRGLKSDWRGLARWLEQNSRAGRLTAPAKIVVHPSDPRFPRDQVEAARYYLAPKHVVVLAGEGGEPARSDGVKTYDAYCLSKPGDRPSQAYAAVFSGLIVRERRRETSPH
jgi:4-amino-4-deoxy-L-arabinose transferase-like glycosyltransferase